jgi:hypothetical protein
MNDDQFLRVIPQGSTVRIANLPTTWRLLDGSLHHTTDTFRFKSIKGDVAIFEQTAEHSNFEVPLRNIDGVHFGTDGPSLELNRRVMYVPETQGYGYYWRLAPEPFPAFLVESHGLHLPC